MIQKGRDLIYFADCAEHQWGGVRRLEVIEWDHKNLIKIITACNEVIDFILKIELLRAEISKIQSRRDVFEKTQYEKRVWFDYQGLSNKQYQNVLKEKLLGS